MFDTSGGGGAVNSVTGGTGITDSGTAADPILDHDAHTGDVTGSTALTIGNDIVSNAKASDMPANTVKVNATGALADPQDLAVGTNSILGRLAGAIAVLTGTQVTTLLDAFTSTLKGLVPPSGGGTTNFLRADGTFAAPAGGGAVNSVTGGTNITNSGTAADPVLDHDAHTGDVTGATALTIPSNTVTYAKMQNIVADNTLLGNNSGPNQDPQELSATQARTLLNVEDGSTADQTGAEIKIAYEGELDTNAFTDANVTNLGNQSGTNTGDEPIATTSAEGVVELATDGEDAASVVVQGNDGRLKNNRGVVSTFEFDTSTTMTDPGSGEIRYDNATPGSVTEISVSEIASGGAGLIEYLDLLKTGDAINLGSAADDGAYLTAVIAAPGPVDGGVFRTIPLTSVTGGSLPAAGDEIVLTMIPSASGGGSGDVVGPGVAVSGNVATYSGTTGKVIQDSGLTLSGSNTGDEPDASTTVKGIVELATGVETAAGLAIQADDGRLSDARTPTSHASTHEDGGGDEIDVTNLSGLLADPQTPAPHPFILEHTFDSSTAMANPGAGDIRYNNAVPANVTQMVISKTSNSGVDIGLALSNAKNGDTVYFAVIDDSTKHMAFLVSSILSQPNHYEYFGSVVDSGTLPAASDILVMSIEQFSVPVINPVLVETAVQSAAFNSASPTNVPALTHTMTEAGDVLVHVLINIEPDSNAVLVLYVGVNGTEVTNSQVIKTGADNKKSVEDFIDLTYPLSGLVASDVITAMLDTGGDDSDLNTRRLHIR